MKTIPCSPPLDGDYGVYALDCEMVCFFTSFVHIHQPFSIIFYIFSSKIFKFKGNTSDWLNRMNYEVTLSLQKNLPKTNRSACMDVLADLDFFLCPSIVKLGAYSFCHVCFSDCLFVCLFVYKEFFHWS